MVSVSPNVDREGSPITDKLALHHYIQLDSFGCAHLRLEGDRWVLAVIATPCPLSLRGSMELVDRNHPSVAVRS